MTAQKHWVFLACLVILSLIGMLALWNSTPYGLGLVNDSATYIEGATSILAGNGYMRVSGGGELKPITHFPPLFSLLLAGVGLFGVDLLQGTRVIITLLFGLDIFLVGVSVHKISRSMVFACLGACLLAVSDLHLGVYSFALSEPLFITLMLVSFLCLGESFDQARDAWLVLSGFLLSLAYLTRYAGASLFVTAVLTLLLLMPTKTLKRIAFLLSGAILPIISWQLVTLFQSGAEALGNRQLLWHPSSLPVIFEALKNLLTWIAPNDLLNASSLWGRLLSLFSLLLLPALGAWLVWVVLRRVSKPNQVRGGGGDLALAFTLGLHVLVYLGFLVLTLTFFDASTPLDDRLLSVLYIPLMILFSCALAWIWGRLSGRLAGLRWGLAGLSLLLVGFSIKDGLTAMQTLGREGQGFTHRGLSGSPAMQSIRALPSHTIIYSNKPGAIFLLAGKGAFVAPTPIDPVTSLARSGYQADLAVMHQRVADGEAVLVLFGLRRSQEPGEAELYADLTTGLKMKADYGEIVIFAGSP